MIKKLFPFLACMFLCTISMAQVNNDQRTITTRIADLLAQMPAKDSAHLSAAMQDISAMGAKGLSEMAGMLAAPAKGDNSSLEYAINGFSYYVTQPGREQWRKMSESAYCQALDKTTNNVNKAFILSQLLIVGQSDETVSCVQNYLSDDVLCDPASRVLIEINSKQANEALLSALKSANGNCKLSIIKALGHSRYDNAIPVITSLTSSPDTLVKKVALNALANIGSLSSASVMQNAAAKSGYTFDKINATGSYIIYLEQLTKNGNTKQAKQYAQSLNNSLLKNNQVGTRIAAMSFLSQLEGSKNTSVLIEAAGDKNAEYRAAALKLAADNISPATANVWIQKLKKSSPEIQAEIITMLGNSKAKAALPAMLNALKNNDKTVRLAAIAAAGKTGNEAALPALLNLMKNADKEEIAAIKNAINIMEGNGVVNKVAASLPLMPASAKAALVMVLGDRAAHEKMNLIFPLLKSEDTTLRAAAYSSLQSMASENDLDQLFLLLNEASETKEIIALQDAIIAASKNADHQAELSNKVNQQMNKVPENKKSRYFKILAGIGGNQSISSMAKAFENGNAAAKDAALGALSSWSDGSAIKTLYDIAEQADNSKYSNEALTGYILSINKGNYPGAQQLLLLRKAMAIANTAPQKQMILKSAGNISTFPALVFAGEYLNDDALQQASAHAVMDIALSDKNFYGSAVKELLNKTIQVLKGADSEYEKEAMRKFLSEMPEGEGFVAIFDGNSLSGWKGLVGNPIKRSKMSESELAKEQTKADEIMREGWYAKDGVLNFTGKGDNICTEKKYGDFEMLVDWKITKDGDAGIYLRGTPQVQIWDTSRTDVGAQVGSGGLYNNTKHPSKPLVLADNAIGDWNSFRIIMKGDRVTVYLNGQLVVDNVIMENYWDRSLPIFIKEQIELQAHGTHVAYRDIYIREIASPKPFELSDEEKKDGFTILFDGTGMHHWMGNTESYVVEDGNIVIRPEKGSGGNLYTKEEYGDFIYRFEFMLTPGANNGLGIRTPLEGDAAYVGMELQILDNDADVYKNLEKYQYHGSVYGVIPAKRGFLKPLGEWNYEEVTVKGNKIKVVLNGTVILDGDIAEASKNGTLDHKAHPGLKRDKGHIAFLGHGSVVKFRNIRVKKIEN